MNVFTLHAQACHLELHGLRDTALARKRDLTRTQTECLLSVANSTDRDKEIQMRIAALAILTLGAVSLAAPAMAQTYGPNYPVCLQVYGPLNYFECSFNSIPQCNMAASGRSAQCVINPYFANAESRPTSRRHRGVY